ncbi:MAG: response regulator, partial [Deltaproteobacteria bacterium]|nr:response regulator [Deltaproteobacteria bacterium]
MNSKTDMPEYVILVVDDNPTNLKVITDYLDEHNFEIITARDGEGGLERAQFVQPDLILLDIVLPGIDGFEVCRRLKANQATKDIPVIFMTVLTEAKHRRQGFQVGAVDYITKPFQKEEILVRIAGLRLQELTEHLEQKVQERTRELTAANQQLEQEVAERKRAEKALLKVNRALKMISECNQVMLHAAEEPVLLHDICQNIVTIGGYRLAWVGLVEHDEAKTVRPVAQAGYEQGYLDTMNLTWADAERGRGPTGVTIRTGNPSIVKNILTNPNYAPWRAEAVKRGYASSVALPLLADRQTLGVLNVYATEPDAFDAEEVALLMELAADMAYGLMTL